MPRRCRASGPGLVMAGLLLGGVLVSAVAGEVGPDPAEALERALHMAEASLQAGEFQAAETHYRDALFDGFLLMGTLERLDGRLQEARDAVRTASAFVVERGTGLRTLAGAYVQLAETERAAEILTDLADKDPRDVEARRLLARILAADGRREGAVQRLDEAVAAAPQDPETVFLLATEYLWLKEVKTAERLFAEVLKAKAIPQTHVLVGRAYRDAGEYDRARTELREALKQDPAVRRAHYYLGMVGLADAKTSEPLKQAEAEFREELKLAPEDPLTNDQLGLALLDATRPAEALPLLETAVRGEARSLFVYHLGRCQLALDRPAEAAVSLRRALALAGDQGASEAELEPIHYQLGQALRRLGAREEAAEHLGQAGRLAARRRDTAPNASTPRPETPAATPLTGAAPPAGMPPTHRIELKRRVTSGLTRAYFNLGVLAAQSKGVEPPAERFARAATLLEKAAALDPDFPQVQSSLGVAYFNARRFEESIAPLTRALAARPQDADLRRMLATACVNTRSWERAVVLLQDDSGRENDLSLQFAYGLALLRSGRAKEAEPVLRRAVQLNAAAGDAHAALGAVLMSLDRVAEGVEHLETAVRLAPDDPHVHEQLGQAYRRLGRSDEAERQFATSRKLLAPGREGQP